mmetsp:Transcript_5067/g.13529  ORF Transcript_5067/g.13529 Transcript_5067/m.13529 type:complete len:122 (+) Transcript_5067:472-837(+)
MARCGTEDGDIDTCAGADTIMALTLSLSYVAQRSDEMSLQTIMKARVQARKQTTERARIAENETTKMILDRRQRTQLTCVRAMARRYVRLCVALHLLGARPAEISTPLSDQRWLMVRRCRY